MINELSFLLIACLWVSRPIQVCTIPLLHILALFLYGRPSSLLREIFFFTEGGVAEYYIHRRTTLIDPPEINTRSASYGAITRHYIERIGSMLNLIIFEF